jgi:Fe-S cluster assembly iron-binding protein IscA
MLKEFKISFQKRFDSKGYVYTQNINLKEETFNKIKQKLKNSKSKNLYLKIPLKQEGNFVFLNLTQKDFFAKQLNLNLKDRNTSIKII